MISVSINVSLFDFFLSRDICIFRDEKREREREIEAVEDVLEKRKRANASKREREKRGGSWCKLFWGYHAYRQRETGAECSNRADLTLIELECRHH